MARSGIYPPSVQPGKPRLGAVPEGWTTYRFADLFDVIERPAKLLDDSEYQLITAKRSRGGVVARERLLGRDILTKTQFYVEEDDFVISNRQIIHGGCGIVPAALDGAVVSNEYTVLRPKSVLLLDYLRYLPHTTFLQQTFFHASVGVDVEKMVFDLDQWLGFKVHLPPVREQRDIAEILTSVDEGIAATKAVIEQTQRVRACLLDSFFHRGSWDEGRPIPDEWNLTLLDDAAKRGSGHTPSKQHPQYWDGGIKWVSLQDTKRLDRVFISETTAEISPLGIANSSAVLHPAGIVVLSRDATVGRSAITTEPMAVSQHFIAWNCGGSLEKLYLYYWLQHMKPVFDRIGAGSTIKTIGLPFFKKLEIPLPPLPIQQRLGQRMLEVDEAIFAEQKTLERLNIMKSALMSDLLTGRQRVSS